MDRRTVWIVVVALAAGYWLASSHQPSRPSDRPVLRFVAKLAKNCLWFALLAEPAPADPQPDHRLAHTARIGDDGYPIVDNARGW